MLITGASGVVGFRLAELASQRNDTTATYYHNRVVGGGEAVQLDLRDRDAVLRLVVDRQPDVIIHAAASDRTRPMAETNRLAARHILEAAQQIGCRVITFSSDMVFDGTRPPYDEYTPPAPISEYGQVKAEIEQLFTTGKNALVIRTSLIYDFRPGSYQLAWMLDHIRAGKQVPLFVDEIRMPMWALNLAEAVLELADTSVTGILNVAGPQSISRWELGARLLEAAGYSAEKHARPVSIHDGGVRRPANLTLRLDRACAALKTTPLLSLDEALSLGRR
ncbi:MAG: SDR family oxidoreductase [Anaerolineae bacterium]